MTPPNFDESIYEKELKIINIQKAGNIGLIFMIPVFLLFGGLYIVLNGNPLSGFFNSSMSLGSFFVKFSLFVAVIVLGAAVHELIHGITWAVFLKNGFKSIKFGVIWKHLTPYCHSKEPMKIKYYLLGAIMPALLLGFVPAVWGIIVSNFYVTFFGIIFIIAAIGDFMVIHLLIHENMNDYAQDHPSEAGCYVFRKKI